MFVTTLWEREWVLFFFFFSRPQSSEFLQPARLEMLEKVSNSQAKPISITKFPSQLIETPVFLPASKIPLGNRLCEEQIRWVTLEHVDVKTLCLPQELVDHI